LAVTIADVVPKLPLIIGVSTRAMFDLAEEHRVFRQEGLAAYAALQLEREKQPLKKGAAFEVTRRLLALNKDGESPVVEIVLLSKNSPDLSLRAFDSFEHYQIPIRHGSFISGRSLAPFAIAWNADLFLSNDGNDVREAAAAGIAAATLGAAPDAVADESEDEVRFALDGDSVIFSEASDNRYKEHGLAKFHQHEREHAIVPMDRGPFGKTFLPKLAQLRKMYMRDDGTSLVRIAIVTARNAPAHERVVRTLRAWGTPADEAHFVGSHAKEPILRATRAHIFFDDQEKHVVGASKILPAGLVPGPHLAEKLVIPA
jgi:5'-nucleotidase